MRFLRVVTGAGPDAVDIARRDYVVRDHAGLLAGADRRGHCRTARRSAPRNPQAPSRGRKNRSAWRSRRPIRVADRAPGRLMPFGLRSDRPACAKRHIVLSRIELPDAYREGVFSGLRRRMEGVMEELSRHNALNILFTVSFFASFVFTLLHFG